MNNFLTETRRTERTEKIAAGHSIYFKNLDALRFFAFFSVFLFHSFWTNSPNVEANPIYQFIHQITRIGDLGVNFFFVLSGFLISYLLIQEENSTGTINIRNFYMRRILRIWPPFYLICISLIILVPFFYHLLKGHIFELNITPWRYFTFLSNFDQLRHDATLPTLNSLWSVSVEEQFYAFWPLLFVIFKKKHTIIPIVVVMLTSIVFRCIYFNQQNVLNGHTLSVIEDMSLGGLLAYCCSYYKNTVHRIANKLSRWIILFVYLFMISFIYWANSSANKYVVIFDRFIFALFFAFVIFEQVYATKSFFKAGSSKTLTKLGRITYGLYLYHYLCLYAALKIGQIVGWDHSVFGVLVLDNVVGLALSIGISWVSYNYFEKLFLSFKKYFIYNTSARSLE